MTYCLGIKTKDGLVLASDSRTNAGLDLVNTSGKMHFLSKPGERLFVLLTSGGLSLTQSILTLLRSDFDAGRGLATVESFYDAARVVGDRVRDVADRDRAALERDNIPFNVHLIVGGQIGAAPPDLYLVYPQGNPLQVTRDCPYLQIGEIKYGRPILDRGIRHDETSLEQAAKYAVISLDSTMRSNMMVGPPIDLVAYGNDELAIKRHRRFAADDPQLVSIRTTWEQELRRAAQMLPAIRFD